MKDREQREQRKQKYDEKVRLEQRIRRCRSMCLRWTVVKQSYPHELRQLDRDITEMQARRDKMQHDLDIAPDEHEKAKRRLHSTLAQETRIAAQPKVDRALKLAAQLAQITEDLEGVDITPEQMELLRKAAEIADKL